MGFWLVAMVTDKEKRFRVSEKDPEGEKKDLTKHNLTLLP
ncbi:hypothetical protein D082_04690 [Synechocystis sp. PCC 6714]|nr:hypothetical protein D082_04690 [Synechocystis sp. PCC 6714]